MDEWHHETVQHISVQHWALTLIGEDTVILIPAQHIIDNWNELEQLERLARKDWRQIVGIKLSWRIVECADGSTDLQVSVGEQPIDTTIGERRAWSVASRSQMHTFYRRPPLGTIRRIS